MIEYTNKLDFETLNALFNKEILVLVVENYKLYKNISKIRDSINEQHLSSYEFENNIVNHLGTSSYEIDERIESAELYYNNVHNNYQIMDKIFFPYKTPIQYFQDDVATIWKPGLKLANFHGKKMFAGLIRIIHKGSAIHAHQDLVSWSNQKAKDIEDIKWQFGVNLFLQVPEEGGHLLLWNQHLNFNDFYKKSMGDFCIPIDNLPNPDIKIKPKEGMLVLLNSHYLHAIEKSIDKNRIASSFFLAYRAHDKPLTYWT